MCCYRINIAQLKQVLLSGSRYIADVDESEKNPRHVTYVVVVRFGVLRRSPCRQR